MGDAEAILAGPKVPTVRVGRVVVDTFRVGRPPANVALPPVVASALRPVAPTPRLAVDETFHRRSRQNVGRPGPLGQTRRPPARAREPVGRRHDTRRVGGQVTPPRLQAVLRRPLDDPAHVVGPAVERPLIGPGLVGLLDSPSANLRAPLLTGPARQGVLVLLPRLVRRLVALGLPRLPDAATARPVVVAP